MAYTIIEHTPTGVKERDLSLSEIKSRANEGDVQALRELLDRGEVSETNPEEIIKAMLGRGDII